MTQSMSRRVLALGLTLTVGSLVATPAHAGNPSLPRKAAKGALAASADARVASLDVSALATQAPVPAGGTERKSFFKSGKGIAVILLFVGGTAWTIASARDKRINSPIR